MVNEVKLSQGLGDVARTMIADFSIQRTAGVEAGLVAVFAFPMFHGLDRFGALDLCCDTPGGKRS